MTKSEEQKSPYEAVLALSLVPLVIHYFFFPADPRWLAGTIVFVFLCLLSKNIASWVDWAWNKLALGLSWFMGNILFSLVFYLLLTPIALLYRLFRKDTFYKSPDQDSYFLDRNHQYGADDVRDPW